MQARKATGVILAMACAGIFSINLSAEEEEPNLHWMYHIEVKPGHGEAFYAALAKHAQWRREQGDPWSWYVHVVETGEHVGDCVIRSEALSWEQLDGYEEFGQKGGSKFWEDVGAHVEGSSSSIEATDSRFKNVMEDQSGLRFVNVIHYELNPNMEEAFAEAVKTYHDAIVEHGYPTYYVFDWPVSGVTGHDVTLALLYTSWADMAPEEEKLSEFMIRIMGEAKAKAAQEAFQACVKSSSSTIVRFVPELSVMNQE